MRPVSTISVLLLVPLLQCVTRPARAADAAKPWRVAYDHCQKLNSQGDYDNALAECERAYALNPDPGIVAYIAQIQTALLHPVQARAALLRYLKSDQLDEENRKTAEAQIRYLETLIGTLSVTTHLAGAEIRVDDQVLEPSVRERGISLPSGSHRVTLKANDATYSQYIVLRAGERTRLELPGSGSIALRCNVPQVRTFIDDREVDVAQASNGLPQAAGSHRVSFKAGTSTWPTQEVQVNPDERITAVCAAQSAAHGSAPPKSNPRGYWIVGAGLALGGAALATAIYSGREYNRWQTANDSLRRDISTENLPFSEQTRRAQENEQLMDSIQQGRNVAIGLGIAAGLVTAGGVALLFADSPTPARNGSSAWPRKIATGVSLRAATTYGELTWRGAW